MSSTTDDAEQIRNLMARIAHLADEGTMEEYVKVFTPDAVWEMPANPAVGVGASKRVGADDIVAGAVERRAAGTGGPGSFMRHVVSTVSIDFDANDPDRANTVAYWMFFNDTSTAPRLVSMGRYDTEVKRYEGEWRVAHRRITLG